MRILDEQEKRESLKELLIDLSKSQAALREPKDRVSFFVRLEDIYYKCEEENFRHFYSDIFAVLSLIDADSSLGSLDVLTQNMDTIKSGYVPKNKDGNNQVIDISKEIIKLYDHTNLEISRINYSKTISHDTLSELSRTKVMVDNMQTQIEQFKQDVKDEIDRSTEYSRNLFEKNQAIIRGVYDEQKDLQKEYISILGIFASVVLAFSGGAIFSSSVIENIHKSSIYRMALLAFVIGLVFYNLVWVLLEFIRSIHDKPAKKTVYWWGVNAILVLGIVFTCVAYKYDWFARESKMTEQKNQQIVQEAVEEEMLEEAE